MTRNRFDTQFGSAEFSSEDPDHRSIVVDKKRTEPLITKAYDAFRRNKHIDLKVLDNLVPTETYIDQQYKQSFRDTALSGLNHAQRLIESAGLQTAEASAERDVNEKTSPQTLPPIVAGSQSSPSEGGPES